MPPAGSQPRVPGCQGESRGKLVLQLDYWAGVFNLLSLSPNDRSLSNWKLLARRIVPYEQAQMDACMHVGEEVNIAYGIRLVLPHKRAIARRYYY